MTLNATPINAATSFADALGRDEDLRAGKPEYIDQAYLNPNVERFGWKYHILSNFPGDTTNAARTSLLWKIHLTQSCNISPIARGHFKGIDKVPSG